MPVSPLSHAPTNTSPYQSIYSWSLLLAFISRKGVLFSTASPECVSSQLLRIENLISPLFCPAGYWGSAVSSSRTRSWLLLQLPHSQLLEKVEVVSRRAGEQRRKKRIYTLEFWKLESREKLKNVTWGQNAWLSSYRAERGRFIPIATLWPMSCQKLPASVMCGGFTGTSPSLVSFLQCCGRKGITE